MTRTNPTRPDDLTPPDLGALASALRSGEPMTCWRVGVVADPTMAMLHGINGQAKRTGGAGWLHATCRMATQAWSTDILLLVGHGRGTEPTWAKVAEVAGKQVAWVGMSGDVNPVQDMRSRLVVALLRSLGYVVRGCTYQDGKLLPTDRVLVGATCQREGCFRPLTTPESILSGYGPTCGGRVKAPRSYANINLADAMRERMKVK